MVVVFTSMNTYAYICKLFKISFIYSTPISIINSPKSKNRILAAYQDKVTG